MSHSSADDPYTADLRDALYRALEDVGLEPLLDKERLEPGMRWRTKLFNWMATCEGAVLLLDEAGLTSKWVRAEATILAWRAALNPELRLIPILIGQPRSALLAAGLNPVEIDELQLVRPTDESAEDIAIQVAEAMRDLQPRRRPGPMSKWASDVAGRLRDDDFLKDVAIDLDIDDQDWDLPGADLRYSVAYRLLHSDPDEIERAATCLFDSVSREDREHLGRLLSPSCLPSDVAGALLAIIAGDETRVARLRADQESTARRLITRATCGDRRVRVVEPPATEGNGEFDVTDQAQRFRGELLRRYGVSRSPNTIESAVDSYHRNKGDLCVVIEDIPKHGVPIETTRPAEVLAALHAEFRKVLFVYAGLAERLDQVGPTLDQLNAVDVSPGIDPELEKKAWPIANRLEGVG